MEKLVFNRLVTKSYTSESKHLLVTGFATTNRLDRENEAITITPEVFQEAAEKFLKTNNKILVEHGLDDEFADSLVGVVINFVYPDSYKLGDPLQISVLCRIENSKAIKLIKEGILNSFSLSWEPAEVYISEDDDTKQIHVGITINEVTICKLPANPDCKFTIVDPENTEILEMFSFKEGEEVNVKNESVYIKSLLINDNKERFYNVKFKNSFTKSEKIVSEKDINEYIKQSFTGYPKKASENAQRALKWREKYPDQVKFGTRIGWTRANQLANREPLSLDTVKRMAQFNRHRENSKINPEYINTPWLDRGYGAWLLWGGDEGVDWSIRKLDQLKKNKDFQKKWDGDKTRQDLKKWATKNGRLDIDKYSEGFIYRDKTESRNNLGAYKLPVYEVVNEKLVLNEEGLIAARNAFMGARGGIDLPAKDKNTVKNKLNRLTTEINKQRKAEDKQPLAKLKSAIYSINSNKNMLNDEIKTMLQDKINNLVAEMGLEDTPSNFSFKEKVNKAGDSIICVYFSLPTDVGNEHVVEYKLDDELDSDGVYTILEEEGKVESDNQIEEAIVEAEDEGLESKNVLYSMTSEEMENLKKEMKASYMEDMKSYMEDMKKMLLSEIKNIQTTGVDAKNIHNEDKPKQKSLDTFVIKNNINYIN